MAVCKATGRKLSLVDVSAEERAFSRCVSAMLDETSFLLPLVTAARQYWTFYHQMTAASLYEDLWSEALQEFVEAEDWGSFSTTPRGAEGKDGDYIFNGLPISHKTSSAVADIAVLWDSLIAQDSSDSWSSETPILFMGLGYGKKTRRWSSGTGSKTLRAVWFKGGFEVASGSRCLALIGWKGDGTARVVEVFQALPTFSRIWMAIESHAGSDFKLNEFELLNVPNDLRPGDTGQIDCEQRPGSFLFPRDLLRDVPMGKNNRGLLIKKPTVISLCQSARSLGTATPFPVWPQIYADFESSGLLTAQRQMCSNSFPVLGLADPEN